MILTKLQEKFPDMPNLRVRDIRVDKVNRKVFCVVSYPDSVTLSDNIIAEIKRTVVSAVPKGYRCDVKIVNDRFNSASFVATLTDLLKKRFPIYSHIKAENIRATVIGRNVSAVFVVDEPTQKSLEGTETVQKLQEFFSWFTCYSVSFDFERDENAVFTQEMFDEQKRLVQLAINKNLLKPQRYFTVTNVEKYLGKIICANPMYISDVRTPLETCVLCGKLSEKKVLTPKNKPHLRILKFVLTDDSGSKIPCVMFVELKPEDIETLTLTYADKTDEEIAKLSKRRHSANDNKLKCLTFLGEGLDVLVRGSVVYSDFSQALEMHAYSLCKCEIQPLSKQPTFKGVAPAEYMLVKPTEIQEYRQMTIMKLREKTSPLSGSEVVLVCANLTGGNVTKDKMYGFCAIRLVNGHPREKFFTLVQPETKLTEVQMKNAHLTERQLIVSPTLTEIVPDIFKFLANSPLVGVDLLPVLNFLNYYGAPFGFNFKNETMGQTEMLSSLFDKSTFDGKPNCSQIVELLKCLKLSCPLSENCEDVAMAVAEIISTLVQNVR